TVTRRRGNIIGREADRTGAVTTIYNAGTGLNIAGRHRCIAVATVLDRAEPNACPCEVARGAICDGDVAGRKVPIGSSRAGHGGPVRVAVQSHTITTAILETVDRSRVRHAGVDIAGFD